MSIIFVLDKIYLKLKPHAVWNIHNFSNSSLIQNN